MTPEQQLRLNVMTLVMTHCRFTSTENLIEQVDKLTLHILGEGQPKKAAKRK